MAANGSGQILGSSSLLQISGSSPVVLPIDSSAYLSNITIAGNTFQFAATGQQVLSIAMKPSSGPGQVNYTLQVYNNTTGAVVSSYTADSVGGGVGDPVQTVQMVLDVLNVAHTFSLRILVNSQASSNAIQLLGPVFSMIVTTLGGGSGSGTVSGTTNYITKFTAATVAGNSDFINSSTGIMRAIDDADLGLTAGTVSAGTTGTNVSITAQAAKAASAANGGNVNLTPGAGDGAGKNGLVLVPSAYQVCFGTGANGDLAIQNNASSELFVSDRAANPNGTRGAYFATGVDTSSQKTIASTGGYYVSSTCVFAFSSNSAGQGEDVSFYRVAAGVISSGTGGQVRGGWVVSAAGQSYRTATQAVTGVTPTTDDTLTATLISGRKYAFKIVYFFTIVTVGDGFRIDFDTGGATATNFSATLQLYSTGQGQATSASFTTALATDITVSSTVTTTFSCVVEGSILAGSSGVFGPRFAKSTSAAGANLTAGIGSYMSVTDLG